MLYISIDCPGFLFVWINMIVTDDKISVVCQKQNFYQEILIWQNTFMDIAPTQKA